MKKTLLLAILVLVNLPAIAEKAYTKSQLNQMIQSGQYPEQGQITNTTTKSMSFPACKATVENVMSQLRGAYPVITIVDTNILHTVKAWTNDGAITANCSQPDKKMILTQASYK